LEKLVQNYNENYRNSVYNQIEKDINKFQGMEINFEEFADSRKVGFFT
jgi:hypothetical protein